MNIEVAILDDHPMVLEGLGNMLTSATGISLNGAYLNGKDLRHGLQQSLPDILLLDIQMPDKNGDEQVQDILTLYPSLKIIALTNIDAPLYVHNMLRLGVEGYLLKTVAPQQLVAAIKTVYHGRRVIDPSLEGRLLEFTSKMKRETYLKPRLTQREQEVLQYIADGCSSQEIAEKLFISIRTVEYYRFNILLKMDVKNTAMLIRKALSMGIVR